MKSSKKKQPSAPLKRSEIPAAHTRSAGALFAALWGLNYSAFLPLWAQLGLAAAGILFATPLMYPLFQWKAQLLEKRGVSFIALVAGLGAGAAFWLLRMDTVFLGDGASYLAEHFRYVRGLPVSEDVLFSPGSAPLTAWLLAKLSLTFVDTAAQGSVAAQPQLAWWISAAFVGGMYCAAVQLLARHAGGDGLQRFTLVALFILAPGFLFFFGYVEYYTFAYAALRLYLLLTMAVLQDGIAPVWLVLSFVLMAVFHLMMLVALPGLLLTLAARQERLRPLLTLRNLLMLTAAVLAAGGVFYFASGIATEGSRVVLALHPFGEKGAIQHYTLLSTAHLVDVVNMLLLAAGPALLALVFVPWRKRGWEISELVFLAHLLYFAFLLFFGYTCFGMARDWDVNAGFGLVAAAFAVVMLRRRDGSERAYLYYLVTGAALVALIPWIAVNVDSESSEQRFRTVVALDDDLITGDFALNGYEHLRKYYQSVDDGEAMAWAIRRKVEMVGYPEDFRKLMLQVLSALRGAQQKEYLDFTFAALEEKLSASETEADLYAGSRQDFIELYAEFLQQVPYVAAVRGEREEYFRMRLRRFQSAAGDHPLVAFSAAQYEAEVLGRPVDPAPLRRAADAIRGSSLLAATCGRMLLSAAAYPAARDILTRGVAMDSGFTLPHWYPGQAWSEGPGADPDAAIHHYQQFVASPEGHRISDPQAQQRMVDEARQRIGELELQKLQYP